MNLKDRGVTVGDLMILLIIIFSTIFIINKSKYSEKQTHLYTNNSEISSTILL